MMRWIGNPAPSSLDRQLWCSGTPWLRGTAALAALVLAGTLSACAARQPLTPNPTEPPTATPVTPTPSAPESAPEPAPAPLPGTPSPRATPTPPPISTEVGLASFYGRRFQGKTTASGVPFDFHKPVAAHPSLPFGTRVRVTNLKNGRQVVVTIIDRGPVERYVRQGVIIDLSQGAAETLGFIRDGRQRVRIEVLQRGSSFEEI